MTEELFREDSYIRECAAEVAAATAEGIVLDRTVFYPMGGGQPGDTGQLRWEGGSVAVVDTRYGENREILHILAPGSPLPRPGDSVQAAIDWDRRYRHMRMHTALHLLGAVLRYGVTGGNIGSDADRAHCGQRVCWAARGAGQCVAGACDCQNILRVGERRLY